MSLCSSAPPSSACCDASQGASTTCDETGSTCGGRRASTCLDSMGQGGSTTCDGAGSTCGGESGEMSVCGGQGSVCGGGGGGGCGEVTPSGYSSVSQSTHPSPGKKQNQFTVKS